MFEVLAADGERVSPEAIAVHGTREGSLGDTAVCWARSHGLRACFGVGGMGPFLGCHSEVAGGTQGEVRWLSLGLDRSTLPASWSPSVAG